MKKISQKLFPRKFFIIGSRKLSTKTVSVPLADIGEGIYEVEVLEWKVKEGDIVEEFGPLCEVRSDKAIAEITSKYAGKIKSFHCTEGGWVKVGNPLFDIDISFEEKQEQIERNVEMDKPKRPESSHISSSVPRCDGQRKNVLLTSPRVRHAMATYGFEKKDIDAVQSQGYLTELHLQNLIDQRARIGISHVNSSDVPASVVNRSHMQKEMSRKMHSSLEVPHFTACEEVEMDALIEYHNALVKKQDITSKAQEHPLYNKISQETSQLSPNRFSIMNLIVKIISEAILQHPLINSQYISDSQIRILQHHNIGIAIDTQEGLVVPNIKKVESKSIVEIYLHLSRLIALSKKQKLTFEDLARGSFTISNIGSIGSTHSQPVVVPPESCIISLGRIRKQARFRQNGEMYCASIMTVSCSADHRVLDGGYLVRFLNKIRDLSESPTFLDGFV